MLALFLVGCIESKSDLQVPVDRNSIAVTEEKSDEAEEPTEGIDNVVIEDTPCPEGFVGIPNSNPEFCLMAYEAVLTEGRVASIKGQRPSINLSFFQARELCESYYEAGSEGQSLRQGRLVTYDEWLDAGDGEIGAGGTVFPWGDSSDPERCVLPNPETGIVWDDYQPAGSMRDCVSSFGVYDQLGNIWEWVDEQINVDIASWILQRQEEGLELLLQEGELLYQSGDLEQIFPHVVAFPFERFDTDANGRIYAIGNFPYPSDGPKVGYLMPSDPLSEASRSALLPIRLQFDEDMIRALVIVEEERDQEPIATKVGGSFYSGGDQSLHTKFYGHVPTFDGSIGFRCSIDPKGK